MCCNTTTGAFYPIMPSLANASLAPKEESHQYTVLSVYDILLHSEQFWIFGLCSIFGTIGNTVVVGTVIANTSLHRPTFVVLCSLALVDFLVVNVMFLSMTDVDLYWTNKWSHDNYILWIDILQTSRAILTVCSSYHIVILAGVRYFIIVHPIKAQVSLSCKISMVISALTWFLPSLVIIIIALVSVLVFNLDYLMDPALGIVYCVFYYVIPLAVMSVFHCIKIMKLQNRSVSLGTNSEVRRSFRHMNLMVAIVIILQLLLLFPFMLHVLSRYVEALDVDELGSVAAYCQAINSCINPYIYAFMCKAFRHSVFCYKCLVKNSASTVTARSTYYGTSV